MQKAQLKMHWKVRGRKKYPQWNIKDQKKMQGTKERYYRHPQSRRQYWKRKYHENPKQQKECEKKKYQRNPKPKIEYEKWNIGKILNKRGYEKKIYGQSPKKKKIWKN